LAAGTIFKGSGSGSGSVSDNDLQGCRATRWSQSTTMAERAMRKQCINGMRLLGHWKSTFDQVHTTSPLSRWRRQCYEALGHVTLLSCAVLFITRPTSVVERGTKFSEATLYAECPIIVMSQTDLVL